jgi:hypothetical protein
MPQISLCRCIQCLRLTPITTSQFHYQYEHQNSKIDAIASTKAVEHPKLRTPRVSRCFLRLRSASQALSFLQVFRLKCWSASAVFFSVTRAGSPAVCLCLLNSSCYEAPHYVSFALSTRRPRSNNLVLHFMKQ